MNRSPWPTSWRGSGMTSSTIWSARTGPPAAIRPTSGTIAASMASAISVGCSRSGPLGGTQLVVVESKGQQDLHRAWPLRIPPQVPDPLQLRELVGDARQAREAHRVSDLAHGRGIAVGADRPLDRLQDLLLPGGHPLGHLAPSRAATGGEHRGSQVGGLFIQWSVGLFHGRCPFDKNPGDPTDPDVFRGRAYFVSGG